jgi:hypothetical protein
MEDNDERPYTSGMTVAPLPCPDPKLAEPVLSRLKDVQRLAGPWLPTWSADCPFHYYSPNSLRIWVDWDERVHVTCLGVPRPGDVLHAVGLDIHDLSPAVAARQRGRR